MAARVAHDIRYESKRLGRIDERVANMYSLRMSFCMVPASLLWSTPSPLRKRKQELGLQHHSWSSTRTYGRRWSSTFMSTNRRYRPYQRRPAARDRVKPAMVSEVKAQRAPCPASTYGKRHCFLRSGEASILSDCPGRCVHERMVPREGEDARWARIFQLSVAV